MTIVRTRLPSMLAPTWTENGADERSEQACERNPGGAATPAEQVRRQAGPYERANRQA